jgi:hypothetical protein
MRTLGTYSPDGHHLALLLTAASDANASAVEIALLNQATHRLTVIAGTDMDIIPTADLEHRRPLATDHQPRSAADRTRQPTHTRHLQVATLPD